MTPWQMNGAGDDPVEFYAEVEPKVWKIAEEYRASGRLRTDRDAAKERLEALLGNARMVTDCNAIVSKHMKKGCDVYVCGVVVMAEHLPPPGDKLNRLYHVGAAETILWSIDVPLRTL